MRKLKVIIGFCFLIVLTGCSTAGNAVYPDIQQTGESHLADSNHWTWGVWALDFSADHRDVNVIPQRHSDYHYCVTKFVEGAPCPDCLQLGKPKIQADGTVKLNVTLAHPFKNTPFYTGFDVRGTVYFPPTSIHMVNLNTYSWLYSGHDLYPSSYNGMPLSYSLDSEGGGELLNADGYSCYLVPGVTYSSEWPIFSYYPGKYGKEPTPEFTTVNPYKLFASDSDRRMFLTTDQITREYHLALPPGEFYFGYAVDASWWPPTTTPVTDPAIDFPKAANAEDPWMIEYEQLLPICEENIGKDIFKVTIHDRGSYTWIYWSAMIYSWDLSTSPLYEPDDWQLFFGIDEVVDEFTKTGNCELDLWWYYKAINVCGIPGNHLGVLVVYYKTNQFEKENAQMEWIYGVRFVDIYVE